MSDNWINSRLGGWLSLLLGEGTTALPGDISVTSGPPGPDGGPASQAGRAKQGINLHLLSIAPHAQATARVEHRIESQLVLRYLVTSWAEQQDAAEALLCMLAFHLLGRGASGPDGRTEIIVEATPPPFEVLAALGLPPRPALMLRLPLVHIEVTEPARRVAHPPIVRVEPSVTLRGTVLGPDELPIMAAQVELPAFGRVTETDVAGQFCLTGVPASLADQTIRVRARGVERTFRLPAEGDGGDWTLRMSFEEEG
ncbi:MAG TPA: carboxypeptidase-like regulatory domain-containing protein [Kofleriaceae bacterium]|nr:carboxypeptidase-like regulatory domain-containing protein [Kofleriaceae bacterium]